MAGTGAISACGDTTHRELNMWEDSEFVYIVCVFSISDKVRRRDFPSLDNICVNGIYNPPRRHSQYPIFPHSSNKNDTHVGIQGQTTPVGVRLVKWD